MGVVTVVTSGKGGVGKSSVTAGVGAALAMSGKKVLLIDGDAGLRSLDIILGITSELVFDIYDVLVGNCEPIKAIYPCKSANGLFVMPAPQYIENRISPKVMTRLIKGLSGYYDYVFVVRHSFFIIGCHAAVAVAQRALVVVTPDPVCIRDSYNTRRALNSAEIKDVRMVINRYSDRYIEKNVILHLDYVIDSSGIQLIGVVPEDESVVVAASRGRAVIGFGKASKCYENIAGRMEGKKILLPKKLGDY